MLNAGGQDHDAGPDLDAIQTVMPRADTASNGRGAYSL
jgi:hypothetical protein